MKITEAIEQARLSRRGPGCTFGQFLCKIPDDEREALITLINPETLPRTSSPSISRAIDSVFNVRIGRDAIDRHRKGDCTCKRLGAK